MGVAGTRAYAGFKSRLKQPRPGGVQSSNKEERDDHRGGMEEGRIGLPKAHGWTTSDPECLTPPGRATRRAHRDRSFEATNLVRGVRGRGWRVVCKFDKHRPCGD